MNEFEICSSVSQVEPGDVVTASVDRLMPMANVCHWHFGVEGC